jgi:hypothetical protein
MRHYSRNLVWLLRDGSAENGIARRFCCTNCAIHSASIFPREVLQVPALWLSIAAFSFNHIGRISHAALRAILQQRASVESNIFVFSNFSPAAFLTVMFCGINRAENCVLHKSEREYPITRRIEFSRKPARVFVKGRRCLVHLWLFTFRQTGVHSNWNLTRSKPNKRPKFWEAVLLYSLYSQLSLSSKASKEGKFTFGAAATCASLFMQCVRVVLKVLRYYRSSSA